MTKSELLKFALEIRMEIVKAIGKKGGGHIGGSLSIADLIAVLYGDVMRYHPDEPLWNGRDYLVCSKGHAGPALYVALALKGFFPKEWLEHLNIGGTHLPGHCDRLKVPGIDATTGSLGQGLSIAAGLAKGLKIRNRNQYVFCITGDGEHDEGQIWEAAAFSAHYRLNNLIAFLDWNKMQIDGTNDEVMQLGDLKAKYEIFGWRSEIINGSDVMEIKNAVLQAQNTSCEKPVMIILDVKKGAGVPCIEEIPNNHCIALPVRLTETALAYLQEQYLLTANGE
jgi:transketolase